jgi:Concanavalin A-like lectin/glucanases superfamily/Calx-beta domain
MTHSTKTISFIAFIVSSLTHTAAGRRSRKGERSTAIMQSKTHLIGRIATQIIFAALAMVMLQMSASAATFTVTNANDSGAGSLRQAIADANSNPGFDRITFNIPSSDPNCNATTGVCTIRPQTSFDSLSNLEIDGYTQPGASVNTLANGTNAVLKIEIKGSREVPGHPVGEAFGLFPSAATLKGLIINNFRLRAVGAAHSNRILGCFIGTDATGTFAVPNSRNEDDCAVIVAGNGNLIGIADVSAGALPADRNLISGNLGHGICLADSFTDSITNSNRIQNNLVGTKADGVSPLGNSWNGIFMRNVVSGQIHDNLIANNVIAFNGGIGVNVAHGGVGTRTPPVRNRILSNSIYANGNLGINLGYFLGGVDLNDACDGDAGNFEPNNLQNYPVITSASISGGDYLLNGFLNSTAGGTFTLQFFASDSCDFLSTKGEGKTYLGEITVTDPDGDCTSNFSASFPVPAGAGHVITSTATDAAGNTSEFSGCMVAGDACTGLPANLVSLYRAENNANDSQGVNNGTPQNGATFAPGLVGQAFSFDGADDKVIVPDSPSLNFGTGSFTVETWAKFNNTVGANGRQDIIKKRNFFNFPGWNLGMFQNVLTLDVASSQFGQSVTINADTQVYDGDWFHVAFVVDRTTNTVRLYVNGALQTAQPSIAGFPAFDDASPLHIGYDEQNHAMNGLVDETAIYNRALSATEIQSIYFAGGAGKCQPSTLQFSSATYTAGEGDGNAQITVTRTGPNGTQATVDYATVAGGTATSGSDYTAVNGTLTFDVGETSKTFDIPLNNDTIDEPDETVNLLLSNVTGTSALLGTQTTATLTIVDNDGPPAISIDDVSFVEGGSSAHFTVTLSNPSSQPVTVDYATQDGTATAPADYTAIPTTQLTFQPGETTKTINVTINTDGIDEGSETFFVNLSNPSANATIADNQGQGTIIDPVTAGQLLISEFRFRGVTFSTPQGIDGFRDEYVELYNNTNHAITVATTDGSAGWTLAALNSNNTGADVLVVIPNGTVIPARGHFLAINSDEESTVPPQQNIVPDGGYSLNSYAVGDAFYVTDVSDNAGVALFTTANVANLTPATRLDAAGFAGPSGATADLFREGAGLQSPGANDGQYAFVRRLETGIPQDIDNNAQDFVFVSTDGASYGGVLSVLGAPGPENCGCNPQNPSTNSVSPTQRNATIKASLIEPQALSTSAPNRVRVPNATGPNAPLGTLELRRRFKNNTGQPVTRLRFRVVDVTTLNTPNPGGTQADVRWLNSNDIQVTTSLGMLTVRGTLVESPPQPNGGGLNTTGTVAVASIAPGATVDVRFVLGVAASGRFRFLVNVEAANGAVVPMAGKRGTWDKMIK